MLAIWPTGRAPASPMLLRLFRGCANRSRPRHAADGCAATLTRRRRTCRDRSEIAQIAPLRSACALCRSRFRLGDAWETRIGDSRDADFRDDIAVGGVNADVRSATEPGAICGPALSLLLAELEQRRDQLLHSLARAMRPEQLHQQSLVHRPRTRSPLSRRTQAARAALRAPVTRGGGVTALRGALRWRHLWRPFRTGSCWTSRPWPWTRLPAAAWRSWCSVSSTSGATLRSLETGRAYYRPTLGPEAMAAIIR